MQTNHNRRALIILIIGDLIVLGGVTVMGFASHGTAGTAGARMLTTFLPLVAGWFMLVPLSGVYDVEQATDLRQLWRPFWSMVMAAPMAAFLRAVWLGAPIQAVFVLVLGGVSSLSILAWRAIYLLFARQRQARGISEQGTINN